MEKDYSNKLITLSDGYQYVVIDQTEYKGNKYAIVNEIKDGKLGSNITLFRVETVFNMPRFIEEKNLDIVETILAKLAY